MSEQQTAPHFRPIITELGLQRLMTAAQSNEAVTISQVVLGDSGWSPTAAATELQHECYRTAISGTRRISDTQQHFTFIVHGDSEYWIKEIGLILDDGTLFAIWSDTEHPLAWKAANVDFLLGYDLVLTELPSDNIVIEANNQLTLAPGTQVYRGILRLATPAEANALALDDVALSPATLPQASDTQQGIARFATQSEANDLTANNVAVTPATLPEATETQKGINRLATQAEANAGTQNDVTMTPEKTRAQGDARYAQKDGDYTDLRARATTKSDVGLGNVPNYSATSAINDNSDAKFATARAVKQVNDRIPNVLPQQSLSWGTIQVSARIIDYAEYTVPNGCVLVGRQYDSERDYNPDINTGYDRRIYYLRYQYRSISLN